MIIRKLVAENMKRIKVLAISPTGSLVQVTGDNGEGKTSALDCIPFALIGPRAFDKEPLRQGTDEGFVDLDLGDYTVRREIRRDPTDSSKILSSVAVLSKAGALQSSPQKFLDQMYGKLTFDPAAFDRMEPAKKLAVLKELVDLGIDLDVLDGQNRADTENRKVLNRDLASAEERVKTLAAGVVAAMDVTPIDTAPLFAKTAEASAHNTAIAERRAEAARLRNLAVDTDRAGREIESQIDALRERLMTIRSESISRHDAATQHEAAIANDTPIDVADINEQIKIAQQENAAKSEQARQRAAVGQAEAVRVNLAARADALTENIRQRTAMKEAAIASAKMPVDGLSFGETGVLLNGVPFEQASSAERLRTSFAMAVAMNPTLKIALIRDGSLLSDGSLALIAEMAEANDFQVWVEQVDTSGDVGFVMVDGMVESSPQSRTEEAEMSQHLEQAHNHQELPES